MTDYIKDEVTNTLNHLNRKIKAFENPACDVKEISHLVLQLDAIAQVLPGFIEVQKIDEEIKKAIEAVQKVIDDTLKSIKE